MQVAQQSPRRKLLLGPALFLLCLCLLVYGCVPTERSVVGTYTSYPDVSAIVVDIKRDGTFVQFEGVKEISRGKWRMGQEYLITKDLELEDSYHLPVTDKDLKFGKGPMDYPLYHRRGKLCLDIGDEFLYWCKVK